VTLKAGEVFEITMLAHDTPPSMQDTAYRRAACYQHAAPVATLRFSYGLSRTGPLPIAQEGAGISLRRRVTYCGPRHSGMVRKDQTSDVQLHIGESRDSGFIAARCPGMTACDYAHAPQPHPDLRLLVFCTIFPCSPCSRMLCFSSSRWPLVVSRGTPGGAAGALMALVVLGYGLDGFLRRFCH